MQYLSPSAPNLFDDCKVQEVIELPVDYGGKENFDFDV